jgi:hypothetical protein
MKSFLWNGLALLPERAKMRGFADMDVGDEQRARVLAPDRALGKQR